MKQSFLAILPAGVAMTARAGTNVFFNASQTAVVVTSNPTVVTIRSEGYLP